MFKTLILRSSIEKGSSVATTAFGTLMYGGMLIAALSISTISHAQKAQANNTPAATSSTPAVAQNKHDYGTNPNIFAVLGHKTQEKVMQSAEKVSEVAEKAGAVAEKGVSKIKPSVDQAWNVVTAKPVYKAPIEHKPLNQSTSASTPAAISAPAPTPAATPVPAPIVNPAAATPAPTPAPAPVATPAPVQPAATPTKASDSDLHHL